MGDVGDRTSTSVGDTGDKPTEDPAGEKPPEGDGNPAEPAAGAEKPAKIDVDTILDEHGLDSPEELQEWLKNYRDLKGRIGDQDFDEIVEGYETLQQYQQAWAEQEEAKLREKETPEETIARLEKEKADLTKKRKQEKQQVENAASAKKAIDNFNKTVSTVIEGSGDIPKEWRPFVAEFMGVDNPINEVDIEDRAAVRKITKAGVNKMKQFANLIIKQYADGKMEIPRVSNSETPTPSTAKPKQAKNLSEARKILHESIAGILNKR